MRYILLVILLLAVISIIWVLRDGFTIRSGGGFSQHTAPAFAPRVAERYPVSHAICVLTSQPADRTARYFSSFQAAKMIDLANAGLGLADRNRAFGILATALELAHDLAIVSRR